jgi:hypothetical protein
MNPFKFSADDSSPWNADPSGGQWFPRGRDWKWPADFRSLMGWIFAITILTSLGHVARAVLQPRPRTLLQNLLVGPMFYSAMAALSGIALWAIWKDKSWARWVAVAASSIHSLEFFRQFIIPVRPGFDHYLSSLVAAIIGVAAFSWRDNEVDASMWDRGKSWETGYRKIPRRVSWPPGRGSYSI